MSLLILRGPLPEKVVFPKGDSEQKEAPFDQEMPEDSSDDVPSRGTETDDTGIAVLVNKLDAASVILITRGNTNPRPEFFPDQPREIATPPPRS